MEQFVELMLATDRKAREMIDKARQAKAQAVADAQKQAEEICAADEKRLAAGKAQVDAALAEEKQAQAKALDEEFLRASMRWTAALTQTATPGWTGCANACLRHKSMRCPV